MNYFSLVGNDNHIAGMWNLADRLIQQVALQQKNGQDPDCVPVEMNVKQMIRQLVILTQIWSLFLHCKFF